MIAITDFSQIPHAMTLEPRWGHWRWEEVKGRQTKVPWMTVGKRRADSTDSKTWGDWSQACAALIRRRDADGLAFRLGEGWAGVDLDKCLDDSGWPEEWAERIIMQLCSYTEVSPSGKGVKIFLKGQIPGDRRRKGQIEMYSEARYFTVTGRRFELSPNTVEERQNELAALYEEVFTEERPAPKDPPKPSPVILLDEARILKIAQNAKNGSDFSRLWQGQQTHHSSASERDLALCSHLLFYTGGDTGTADRLFRQSALMREKWDERHGAQTYGAMTLTKALSEMTDFYKTKARPFAAGIGIE